MKQRILLPCLAVLITAGLSFLAVYSGHRHSSGCEAEDGHTGPSGALQALDLWTRARAYPAADIPDSRYVREFARAKTVLKEYHRSPNTFSGWQAIGPINLQGRSISVAINPLNPNTVYCGSASGGLWRSRTGGTGGDWQRIPTGRPALGVSAIVIDPADSNTIYIGTGEVYRYQGTYGGLVIRTTRGSYGVGILKTTDGGETWKDSYSWAYNASEGVQAIKMNPLNHNTLYAATTEGILKTLDAGANWSVILPVYMGEDIIIHRIDTNKVIASCGNFGLVSTVYRSDDGGINFSPLSLPDFSGKTLLESFYSNPDRIYASLADSTTGAGGLYLSEDFGGNWRLLNADAIFEVQGWYSHFVAAHPFDVNQVVHAGVGIFKSTNGGVTFAHSSGSYADHHSYAYLPSLPNVLYVVNDAGIFRSTDFGGSFTNVGFGMQTGQFYNGFSNSSTDSLLSIGQVQDEIPGYIYRGSLVWGRSAVDESGWTAIDQTDDNTMFATSRFGGGMYKSTNRGASFFGVAGFGDLGAWNTPFVLSVSDPSVLYFGHTVVYKSSSGGTGWSPTNYGAALDGNPALSMALARTNSDILYVGTAPYATRAHIWRTTNGGLRWTDVTGSLPDRYPLDLAVDPGDFHTVYAAFGGFGSGHLFKSTSDGDTWADISGSLPDVPATAIAIDPSHTNHLFVGNDLGVFISTDGGGAWLAYNEGLTDAVLVSDLTISPSNRMLRLTTHGNGVFERRLPDVTMLTLAAPRAGDVWQAAKTAAITWDETFIPAIRIDYSTDGGTTWKLIAGNIPAYTGRYDWMVPTLSTKEAMVRIIAEGDSTFRSETSGFFTIHFVGASLITDRGWNIVSIPVKTPDPRRSILFPFAISNAVAYEGAYVDKESLSVGPGYWIKFAAPDIIPVPGDTLSAETLSVSPGWNLIGSLSVPVPASIITAVPPGIVISQYYGFKGNYVTADTIFPGKGYWVKTASAGELILQPGAHRSIASANHPPEGTDGLNQLRITDNSGRCQTLYFGTRLEKNLLAASELPPVPPEGAFDARFSSGRTVESIAPGDPSRARVELRSALYPVVITWQITNRQAGYSLGWGAGMNRSLSAPGGSITLEEASMCSLTLIAGSEAALGNPREFSLQQNYPNPFNPTTTIRYTLAKPQQVLLRIYDITGQVLKTLVDRKQSEGPHAVDFTGSDIPSGIYFYELRTEEFSQTRKMALIR